MELKSKSINQYYFHNSAIGMIEASETKITILFAEGFFDNNHRQYKNARMEINTKAIHNPCEESLSVIEKREDDMTLSVSLETLLIKLRYQSMTVASSLYSDYERMLTLVCAMEGSVYLIRITNIHSFRFFAESEVS